MLNRILRVASCAAALAVAGAAEAHDLWIEPATFHTAPGKILTLRLRVGQDLLGDPVPRNASAIEQFVLVDGETRQPIAGRDGSDPAGVVRIDSRGVLVVGYRSRASAVVLPAQKFNDYLREEGLDAVAAARAKRNQSTAEGRELFSRAAKSLVLSEATTASAGDRALGLRLELVAEANPYGRHTGDDLPIRLLFENRGLPGALVTAINKQDPSARVTGRTDSNGRVRFNLPRSGMWMVKAVHMLPAPADSGADWESIWASLTFELSPERASNDRRAARRPHAWLGTVAGLIAVAAWDAAPLRAHEIGTTRVAVSFGEDRTLRIEIETDAATLIEKLERTARVVRRPVETVALSERLLRLDEVFRQGFTVSIDGRRLAPAIDYVVEAPDDGSAPGVTIRLTGDLPPAAGALTWAYSWTFTPYAFTVGGRQPDVATVEWLEAWQTSAPVPVDAAVVPGRPAGVAWRYLWLGFTHIVPHGFDHVLFVLGIFLLNVRAKPILLQITAFTVSHSITLALSVYGAVSISPAIVEPLIAASIAYVAVENVFVSELKRSRLALVFAFGLLHGLGFAGVLSELGLPPSDRVTALVAFNLGVEGGQLAVIAVAFLMVGWWSAAKDWYRQRMVIPASLGIAGIALFWTFERLGLG